MSSNYQHTTPLQHFRSQDDARALNMLLRMGTVYEVDFEAVPPRARIQSGDLITDLLPFPCDIGANFRRWRPVRVGSQVLFACPSGDSRQGVIVKFYNTVDFPQPDTAEDVDLVAFDDGTILRKDGSILSVDSTVDVEVKAPNINAEAQMQITAKAPQITLDGEVTVTGSLTINGSSVTHGGTDIGNTHIHLIIVPSSGAPVTPPVT